MERIKFYSKYDLTSSTSINNIIKFINHFRSEIEEYNINDILEYFNIIKFSKDDEFKEIIINETNKEFDKVLKIIGKRIGKFIGENKESFLSLYRDVYFEYKEDFFELIEQYSIYNNINDLDFKDLLKNTDVHCYIILKYRKIVDKFDKIICETMLEDSKCAEILINKYMYEEYQDRDKMYLPKSLSQEFKEKILLNYIESENVNPRYIERIIDFPNNSDFKIVDKIRLKSKRRYEKESKKIFESSVCRTISVNIVYDKNQEESVIYTYSGDSSKCSISTKWIEENLDYNTLLNNFIYIFNFFDNQMRLTLVSKISEISALERHLVLDDLNYLYKQSFEFNRKNMMSTSQIYSYVQVLERYKIRLEEVIEWFFKDYLLQEFGIDNYVVKMPTSSSSYFEKCRAILPEMDRILKQYMLYVEDGEIDQELLQMSSAQNKVFENCMSIVGNKYVYPNSKVFTIASNLLFSDQSMISYLPNLEENYNEFYRLIMMVKVKLSDFKEYQIRNIEWLIENNFICEDTDGYLQFVNTNKIAIFLDLYKNGVISYWNYNKVLRCEIDILINENVLKFDNKFFTNDEQDYFNYHLNKSKFSNSLDLRNSYLHGTQTNDEKLHETNYLIFLKLVIIIIVKINDDLCIKEIATK
ncbi:hypothetical protein [Romboutsia lituseburensis]|uniref:Uncharacterized protein n=1 Tax=Romboutsia lituseburensis DSM 797 TaxID=1121325 RepID=A0A1G9MNT1_9FIRM|nr:hypothetical protein [Romboutsia lituseburensis]CEH34386.1 Conserved domain protein [Romboutsia lituseburensis]SDL75691.1 hypothetical protein SAMN04515677_103291 [Romboutsia lituseburensis DSM 797]